MKSKIISNKKNIEQLKEERKISAQVAKKRRLKEKRLNEVVIRVRAEVDSIEKLEQEKLVQFEEQKLIEAEQQKLIEAEQQRLKEEEEQRIEEEEERRIKDYKIPDDYKHPLALKDLAILLSPNAKYLNTNQFLDTIDRNLKKKLN